MEYVLGYHFLLDLCWRRPQEQCRSCSTRRWNMFWVIISFWTSVGVVLKNNAVPAPPGDGICSGLSFPSGPLLASSSRTMPFLLHQAMEYVLGYHFLLDLCWRRPQEQC